MIKSLNFLFLSLLAILTISCSNEDTDIEYDYLPAGILFDRNGYCKHRKRQDDR